MAKEVFINPEVGYMEQINKVISKCNALITYEPLKGYVLAMTPQTPQILYPGLPHSGENINIGVWVCPTGENALERILEWRIRFYEWNIESGSFTNGEYIENLTPGVISTPSNSAYGTWDVELYKSDTGNRTRINFVSNNQNQYNNFNGYMLSFNLDESIGLYKANNGSGQTLLQTTSGYMNIDTWYKVRITRTLDGEFTVYIKSDEDPNFTDWTLVDASGGSGANPVTDTTYTTSNYFVVDLNTGDRVKNLNINGKNSISLNLQRIDGNNHVSALSPATTENSIQIPQNIWTFLQCKILIDTDFGHIKLRKDEDDWTTIFSGDTSTLFISDFTEDFHLGENFQGKIGWLGIWNENVPDPELINFSLYKSRTGKRDYSRETYEYKAEIVSVIDGDTVTANIDLGFDITFYTTIRMARIDAPPLYTATGQQAKLFVQEKIEFFEVKIKTYKDEKEKYGRYICEIFYYNLGQMVCLNDKLVSEGLASYMEW